jgi:hypothetical protein
MRRWLAGLLLACAALTGCGGIEIDTGMKSRSSHRQEIDRFFWGLIDEDFDTRQSAHMVKVVVDTELEDHLLSWLTWGIYCPTTITVWYAEPSQRHDHYEPAK